jgi:hypothetical protein
MLNKSNTYQVIAKTIYWSTTIFTIVFFVLSLSMNLRTQGNTLTKFMFGVFIGIFVSKILMLVLLLISDAFLYVMQWIQRDKHTDFHLHRRQFLYQGLFYISSLPVFGFIYGMLKNKYNYQIHKQEIFFEDLPASFDGLTIVQVSDIHSGSLDDTSAVAKGVEMINALKPDLFLFTGDLVNNYAYEIEPFLDIFSKIQAKLGQYAVLGNHDFSDYVTYNSKDEKRKNLEDLVSHIAKLNWKLLRNEHVILKSSQKEQIALIGIDNWGARMSFARYGNMSKAYQGTESIPFKILMSHDPSHFEAEVTQKYTDVNLTLSGHTHGMQFGIDTAWFKFSPVQFVYRFWAGLYQVGKQFIYVNRGFGFLAYPGRVGILPEITQIILRKK